MIQKIFGLILFSFTLCCFSRLSAETTGYRTEKIPYRNFLPENKLIVVASFDGSKALDRWQDILKFSEENGVKFTFFISGVYFLPDKDRNLYLYPLDSKISGKSDIGFGGASTDVAKRKEDVLNAYNSGHDIETHLNGHFDGTRWTEQNWRTEFNEFNQIASFLPKPVRHVRFPLLAMNHKVFPVLAEFGIRSIVSDVESDYENFNKITLDIQGKRYSFVEFPIAYEHENRSKILLMDYNFYLYDETHHIDPEKSKEEMVALYLDEAERCFKDRRPFFISHHFSNWNHSAYWDAMKKVIQEVSKKYSSEFWTVSELYDKVSND